MLIENTLLHAATLIERSALLLDEARHTPGFTPSGFSVTGGAPHEIGHCELGDRLAMLKIREAQEHPGVVGAFAHSLHIAADTVALARDIAACFDGEGVPHNDAVHPGEGMAEAIRRWREAATAAGDAG